MDSILGLIAAGIATCNAALDDRGVGTGGAGGVIVPPIILRDFVKYFNVFKKRILLSKVQLTIHRKTVLNNLDIQ